MRFDAFGAVSDIPLADPAVAHYIVHQPLGDSVPDHPRAGRRRLVRSRREPGDLGRQRRPDDPHFTADVARPGAEGNFRS
jgi:hypothetical protein